MTLVQKHQAQGLRCLLCQRSSSMDPENYVCDSCGGNQLVEYDFDKIHQGWTRQHLDHNQDKTIWRYLPLLPVNSSLPGPPVGFSPLISAPKLAQIFGLKSLLLKDDGRNPSASLKDRASAVVLARARDLSRELVTGASTGNAASATAVLAAPLGIKTRIFVPKTAPKAKIAQLLTFGAEVLAVDGTYDQAFDLCLEASRRFGWYNRNTGYNPYTREGKKTVSFEICEQLNWQVPDLVVVPVGDGNIISGVWKGFDEFYKLGFIDRRPKLLAVQAEGSAAIVRALQTKGKIQAVEGTTIADSISVSLPRDGEAAVQAINDSKGFGIMVSDEEILNAISEVARGAGVFGEPAAVASYAGLKKAVQQGLIDSSWEVVLLITGNGLKDVSAAMRNAGEPRIIPPDVEVLNKLFPWE